MLSYYRDTILDHENNPFHGGHHHGNDHSQDMTDHGMDMGLIDSGTNEDIPYELLSWSLHHEGDLWRTLTEVSANRTDQGGTGRLSSIWLPRQRIIVRLRPL